MSFLSRLMGAPGHQGAAQADVKSHASSKISSIVKAAFVSSIPSLFLLKLEGTRSMAPWAFVPLFIFTYISSEREQKNRQIQRESIFRDHERQKSHMNQQQLRHFAAIDALIPQPRNQSSNSSSMNTEDLLKMADAIIESVRTTIDLCRATNSLHMQQLQVTRELASVVTEYESTPESNLEKREELKTRMRQLRNETISLTQQIHLKSALSKIYIFLPKTERDIDECKSILRRQMDQIQAMRKLWNKFTQHRHEMTARQAEEVNARIYQNCQNIESSFQQMRDHLKSTDAMLELVEQSITIFMSQPQDENSFQEFEKSQTHIQRLRQEILLLSTAIDEPERSNLEPIAAQIEQ